MMARVLTIALNTYRESVRARILIGLAGVAFAVALYSLVVGSYALENAPRVVSDLGAASISLFSIAVAIIIAATSLHRELEQKTIFPILARPIRRAEYLVGKYLGTLLTIIVFVFANAGLVLLLCAMLGGRSPLLVIGLGAASIVLLLGASIKSTTARTYGPIPWSVALLVLGWLLCDAAPNERSVITGLATLSILEVMVVAALAMLFASFSTPFLSAVLTLMLTVLGRNADSLARLPEKFFGPTIHAAGVGLSKVVPNLQIYVPARPLVAGQVPDAPVVMYIVEAALTSLGWATVVLTVAAVVFRKRDFL